MESWVGASGGDKKLFEAIAACLQRSPHLVEFLFDSQKPELQAPAEDLLLRARGLSSGEYLLVKLAIDLWIQKPHFGINQLFDLEPEIFNDVINSFVRLAQS